MFDSVRNCECALLQPDEEIWIQLIHEAMSEKKFDGIERASKTELIGEVDGTIEWIKIIVRTWLNIRERIVRNFREIHRLEMGRSRSGSGW